MNISDTASAARDQALLELMNLHGDSILRTCFLLCGNLSKARRCAREVFVRAAMYPPYLSLDGRMQARLALLRLAFSLCPCRVCLHSLLLFSGPFSQMLRLPPAQRRIAILCLYHGLSEEAAAVICGISEKRASQLLALAKKSLER